MEWMEDGLCQGKHHDIWFPPLSGERTESEDKYYAVAKMVCEHCPVQRACRIQGMDEEWGVWGGTDPKDRQRGGKPTLPPYVLIPRYLDKVPNHEPGVRVDIQAVMTNLKRYSDKRS